MEITIRKYLFLAVSGLVLCLIGLSCYSVAKAEDWSQWRGPNRDGLCTETGLLKSWPEGGPKLLWELTGLGTGYSSVTIINGKLYTMGDRSIKESAENAQYVIAYDLRTRKELWAAKVGPSHKDGPRCTPTVDDDYVFAIGTDGDLVCVDAADGKILWRKHLQRDLSGGNNPKWKFSESPLIDGEKLLCTPGGRDAVMVALNKKTGVLIWKCSMPDIGPKGKDEAGYSSIVVAEIGGVRQYIQLTNKGLIGVAAKDGRFLWGYNKIANRTASVPTPVIHGEYIFCSTSYKTGSVLLKLIANNSNFNIEEIYFLDYDIFQNHHGGFVKYGDYIYGGHDQNKGKPTCIEMKTGKVMWQAEQPGGGSAAILYADGHLYFRYQDDVIALIEANPQKYNLKSMFKLPKRDGMSGQGWSHPVICDGKLYLRHADVLFCYDIKAH